MMQLSTTVCPGKNMEVADTLSSAFLNERPDAEETYQKICNSKR